MRRSIFVIFVMLGFLYPSVIIAEEVRLSLDEAIAIALRDNRDILLKAEELKKAKTKIAEAKASLLPTLNFIGSWTDTRGSYSKDIAQTSTQTTLKQVLYKGGRIINTIKFNEYEVSIAESILDKAKLDVLLNVKKAFYTLLLTREFVDLNKSMMDNMLEHLQSMKERYKSGQASESDVLSIESSLSNVGQACESSLNQVESAQGLLNNVLYLEKSVKITPEANLDYDKREVAFDEAFLKAMRNRPEIKQYEAQRQANLKTIEIAKSDTRPNIYASWDYYSRSHTIGTTGSLSKNSNDNNIIGLVFSWPIFDGWAAKAKVEQAIVDLKEPWN
jgi:outer membrane protein TolC